MPKNRCGWADGHPLMQAYHDEEWGKPLHDDRRLFEFLVLDGMQAGLSWLTILKKREGFRKAFDGFDPRKIARYRQARRSRLRRGRRNGWGLFRALFTQGGQASSETCQSG